MKMKIKSLPLDQNQEDQPSEANKSQELAYRDIENFTFPKDFDHKNSAIPGNPCYNFRYRIFIFLLNLVITQLGEIFTTPSSGIECINDPWHNLSEPINNLIHESKVFASILQILSSLILDISYFSISIYWVLHIRTIRFFAALISFYVIRFLHLQLLQLKFAEGYYWEDPQVPSMVVKYGWYSDFFYSGHCGFLLLCGLEWRKIGKQKLFYLLLCAALYQAFIVSVYRIHYTIDVPGGFVYSHYIYTMVCHWEVKIDYYNKKMVNWFRCRKQQQNVDHHNGEIEIYKSQDKQLE